MEEFSLVALSVVCLLPSVIKIWRAVSSDGFRKMAFRFGLRCGSVRESLQASPRHVYWAGFCGLAPGKAAVIRNREKQIPMELTSVFIGTAVSD